MQGQSMERIIKRLFKYGAPVREFAALDFFAREGDWQTQKYAFDVASIEAWEIDKAFEKKLRENLPHAKVRIIDSFEQAEKCTEKFDFIVVDNPQNLFGPEKQFCEHFEVIPKILPLIKQGGYLVFNVNWQPFDYEKSPDWRMRREQFYQRKDTHQLELEDFVMPFYTNLFNEFGYEVEESFTDPRNSTYLSNCVFKLTTSKV